MSQNFQAQKHNISSTGPFSSRTFLSDVLSFKDPSTRLCLRDAGCQGYALGEKAAPFRGAPWRRGAWHLQAVFSFCAWRGMLIPEDFSSCRSAGDLCIQDLSQQLPGKHRGLKLRSHELALDLSLPGTPSRVSRIQKHPEALLLSGLTPVPPPVTTYGHLGGGGLGQVQQRQQRWAVVVTAEGRLLAAFPAAGVASPSLGEDWGHTSRSA